MAGNESRAAMQRRNVMVEKEKAGDVPAFFAVTARS
jgi:hypothetical protein